jgi:DNA-binding FrmR family transcriptional regulator
MWPKALAQLIELAPHIARLLPTADRFLQSKSAGDQATREALAKLGDDVRADINRVTGSHEGIYRQLNEQGERFAQLSEQMTAVRTAAEAAEERVAALEQRVAMSSALLAIVLPLNVILVALVIYIVVRH